MIDARLGDVGLEWAKARLKGTSAPERPRLGERLIIDTGAWPGDTGKGSSPSDTELGTSLEDFSKIGDGRCD